ncbi:hypothetical protein N9O97_00450 [Flavobacteriaceae bacterium]|nr:hypothetical protein [Flavobacteriaceae bacterium]MDA9318969.1 hypothetical protein [Flavobacteriaceae bacterium]MDB4092762.1 hypothetical protein [Flavobacteriaceae bacterium]MDC0007970.1 hypothetical protein [Flavobacteriaceae bacterium]MDC1336215.1 hypothetical protein [Flavobacteriaceae bacterium]
MINLKKYLKGVSFIFWFFLGILSVFSQTKPNFKTLKGEIVNDSVSISGIHIINKTSGSKTITDINGVFEIGVKKQDTIIISSVQIIPRVIVMENEMLNQTYLKIYVDQFINELSNVVVRSNSLSGNILKDMANSNVKVPINFDDVGIPGFKGIREEKIEKIVPFIGLPIMSINIEALYKNLSGYYKRLKKRRVWDKQNITTVDVIEFYGVSFFTRSYNLTQDEVYEFVLGAIENSSIQNDFKLSNHGLVLESFDKFYKSRNE